MPPGTDVWAVLGQTAGVSMRGFDVGGSHKSLQTEYESFGIRGQHRVLADGVDTTEGTGGHGASTSTITRPWSSRPPRSAPTWR